MKPFSIALRYIFPGLALGAALGQSGVVTNAMINRSAEALVELISDEVRPLLCKKNFMQSLHDILSDEHRIWRDEQPSRRASTSGRFLCTSLYE